MDISCVGEYAAVPASKRRKVHFIARIETKPEEGGPRRKPLNVALVLDRSGSMSGEKLAYVKQAALTLVEKLTTADVLSVVSYADGAEVHVPPTQVAGKDAVRMAVSGMAAGGSTNLSGGWLKGLSLLRQHAGSGFLSRVLLLTDGEANEGVTGVPELASIARQHQEKGIHTTTIGFGVKFNEELLMTIADDGGGRFHFVKEPEDAPTIFLEEFGELSRVFGQNLEVYIETAARDLPAPRILTDLSVETGRNSAAVRLGDILESERKEVLFSLDLPDLLEKGPAELAGIRVRYDAVRGRTGAQEMSLPVTIEIAPAEAKLPEGNPEVARKLALYMIAREKAEASRRLRSGDRAGATKHLRSATDLTQTSLHLDPDAFSHETQTLTLIMENLHLRRNLEEAQKTLSAEARDFHRGRGSYEKRPAKFSLKPEDPGKVHDVLESVKTALRAAGHDEDLLARADYVCGELIANALEHGCKGQADPRVEVRFEVDRNRFVCAVEDTGPGFDFKETLGREEKLAKDPGSEGRDRERRTVGRGLLSVKREADDLKFNRKGNGVTATLKKKRFKVKTKRRTVTTRAGKLRVGIAAVEGGVDSHSYGMLEERLDEMIKGYGVGSVIVDLSRCGYVSSTGVGVLVKTQRAMKGTNGKVVIVGMKPPMRELFDRAGLAASFVFADTVEAAKRLLASS